MARCLNLTKAGEYAIAALARLALQPENGSAMPVRIGNLAETQKLPETFLSKIIAQCAKAGLVKSRKGPSGGVALARPASEITLLQIVEAIEGELSRDACVFEADKHCDGPDCVNYCDLRKNEDAVRCGLQNVTLADMAQTLRKKETGQTAMNGTVRPGI